ncbi:hypothetical protein A2V49_00275 [candidate division WWE3 bacterium RBG_19FT_COMBO_34_6]|uniref:Clp R domain-containing protein n=1 Tax=candidate division WWE3 bacterium RBG_19FT_COMBO_34_6 TaxID=1802612 RepID=A0A1F4UMX2_UNCKA|nr:MAG: hypothetical protein A2V49_00275 [candidate division WWE3 bacterium RBG_19FT_COMBO_34_6]
MILDRLTDKAKDFVTKASKDRNLNAKQVISYIIDSGGMGKHLIEAVPPIGVKNTQEINIEKLLKEAYLQSIRLEHTYVGTEHFYLALLKMVNSKSLDLAKIELVKVGIFPNTVKPVDENSKKTPLLDVFGDDLTNRSVKIANYDIIYRTEYEKLVSTLLLKDKSNALLIGEPGVGKTSIIHLLVQNINSLSIPPSLAGYRVKSISLLSFMTNLINKGGLEYGVAALIDELRLFNRVILVFDNFQDIFFSTPAGLTIPIFYTILKSALANEKIKVIADMSTSMYEKIVSENETVIDNFTIIEVEEPSTAETKDIMKSNAKKFEEYHNVVITDEIIDYVYEQSQKEIKNSKFPKKALDLLDFTCASVISKKTKIPSSYKDMVDKSFDLSIDLDALVGEGQYDKALRARNKIKKIEDTLTQKEKKIFKHYRKINISKKDVNKVLNLLDLGNQEIKSSRNLVKLSKLAVSIKKLLVGQDEAVDKVSKALIRSKLGLRSKKRPLGNFFFLGPTGVGKTELAKVLALQIFAKDEYQGLIRLDMSDFSEKHTVARLVGAPPGYVGFGEGGELTSKIDAHPNSVVLFDEIEKAHPDVLNILLQIMEEGELADARGNIFDFSKSVIILTSNIGTEILYNKGIGFEEREIEDKNIENRLKENLKKILKPELLNRFDEVIVFARLTKHDQLKILELLLSEVSKALENQEVSLSIGMPIKKNLLEKGYSKEYGARALRRTVEKELLDRVAQILLENESRPLKLEAKLENNQMIIKVI